MSGVLGRTDAASYAFVTFILYNKTIQKTNHFPLFGCPKLEIDILEIVVVRGKLFSTRVIIVIFSLSLTARPLRPCH